MRHSMFSGLQRRNMNIIDRALLEDIPQCLLDCIDRPRWYPFIRSISNRTWLHLMQCRKLPDVIMMALDPDYTPTLRKTSTLYSQLSRITYKMCVVNNPLRLVDSKNRQRSFQTIQDFYRATLNSFRQQFPKGEIDLIKFMNANTDFDKKEVETIIQDALPLIRLDLSENIDDTINVKWDDYLDPRSKFLIIIQNLCYVATWRDEFDRNRFFEAYIDFYFLDCQRGRKK